MNYETRLRHFVEEYATATFGSKDITCEIDSTDDEVISLNAIKKDEVTILMQYHFGKNHGVDERDGIENRKHYFESHPQEHISLAGGSYQKLLALFGRYCNVFSVNYILADISYLVKDESNPMKDLSIAHMGLSNEYRKITMNAMHMETAVEIYLKDGTLFGQYVIESIEE